MITKKDLHQALDQLELSNSDLCVHSSMRSFGDRLEKGPGGLVEVLLERGCTIMVPTFSRKFLAEPDYDEAAVFHPERKDISVERMGILPRYVLQAPGCARGNHPINSFTALGVHGAELVEGQTPRDVYAPFRQLYDRDGLVLLAGVSLNRATIIHYAERRAGRRLFVRRARTADGIIPVSVGGCSEGFDRLSPILEPVRRRVTVGQSTWSCYRARDIVDICAHEIARNPQITHCGDNLCERCNDAVRGGPAISASFWTS